MKDGGAVDLSQAVKGRQLMIFTGIRQHPGRHCLVTPASTTNHKTTGGIRQQEEAKLVARKPASVAANRHRHLPNSYTDQIGPRDEDDTNTAPSGFSLRHQHWVQTAAMCEKHPRRRKGWLVLKSYSDPLCFFLSDTASPIPPQSGPLSELRAELFARH